MYHDTIHINFKYNHFKDVNFDYSFYISKYNEDDALPIKYERFSSIKYGELLQKFNSLGFDLKYLKFYDFSENDTVYCSYNFQPNFNIFFLAYKKLIQPKDFHITFEYGNLLHGRFYTNNMNYFAGIFFISDPIGKHLYKELVIKDKVHYKTMEMYRIIDKDGNIIANNVTDEVNNFEQNFFDRYEVKVALRKYKLSRLKNLSNASNL